MSSVTKENDEETTVLEKKMPDVCRLFKSKEWKALIVATVKFNEPLSANPKVAKIIESFVDWILPRLKEIRDRSTGRKHVLKSDKAVEHFGAELVKKMTAILHIFTSHMQGILFTTTFSLRKKCLDIIIIFFPGSVLPTNDEILNYYLSTFKRLIITYEAKVDKAASALSTSIEGEDNASTRTAANDKGDSVSQSDENDNEPLDLTENFFQVWTKFLLFPMNGKTKKLVIQGVKSNVRKKNIDYYYNIIVKLLQGKSNLVDGAMDDLYKRELYLSRHPLFKTLTPGKQSMIKEVKQFDLVGRGQSFLSKAARLDIGNCPSRSYSDHLGVAEYPYFMGIKPVKVIDTMGVEKCVPSWQGSKDIVQTLLQLLTAECDKLATMQQLLLEKLLVLAHIDNGPHTLDRGIYGMYLKDFLNEHPLITLKNDGEFELPIKGFLCEWIPAYENTEIFFVLGMRIPTEEQPSLSMKLALVADFFRQAFLQLVRELFT